MFKAFARFSIACAAVGGTVGQLFRNQRGSVATTFFFVMVPILLGAGAAIDYSSAVGSRSRATSLADTVSISAARELNAEYARRISAGATDAQAWLAARSRAEREAQALFRANAPKNDPTGYTLAITFSRDGNNFTAQASVTGVVNTSFMQMFGQKTIDIASNAEATSSLTATSDAPVYADVYIMLDRTASMVVGESNQDVLETRKMVVSDGVPCAFACHRNARDSNDDYLRVKASNKVRLKLDAAIDAIASFANTAKPEYHRIAVYTIGHDWWKAHEPLVSLTSDMAAVASAVRTIRPLETGNYDQTEISYSMMQLYNEVLSKLPASGDGSTSSKRKIYLVLITDGVESIHHDVDWRWQDRGTPQWEFVRGSLNRVTGAPYTMGYWIPTGSQIKRIDRSGDKESVCKLVKDRYEIGVLEVEYPDLTGLDETGKYEKLYSKWRSRITGALSDCSSPSLYFRAGNTRGAIEAAAQTLFKSVTTTRTNSVRLTK